MSFILVTYEDVTPQAPYATASQEKQFDQGVGEIGKNSSEFGEIEFGVERTKVLRKKILFFLCLNILHPVYSPKVCILRPDYCII